MRSNRRPTAYRALSMNRPEDTTPQWMVDLDLSEDSRREIRTRKTTAQKCLWWVQCVAVFLFFVAWALVWLSFSLLAFTDSSWRYRWLSAFLAWAILVGWLVFTPSLTFFVLLREVLPFATAFTATLCILQASTWDYCSPWLVAFLTALVLFTGLLPFTKDPKLNSQPIRHRIRLSFVKHKFLFVFVCALVVSYSIVIPLATAGSCVAFYNELTPGPRFGSLQWNTRMSRSYQPPACPPGPPCHVYLTVAENVSSSVYVNVQTHTSVQSVSVSYSRSNFTLPSGEPNVTVQMVRFSIPGLEPHGDRAVHSVLLKGLDPNSTYYFLVQDDPTMRKFRTGPIDLEPYVFVSGGDAGNTPAAVRTTERAVQSEPLFIVVGGDLAYTNALRSCYPCWDTWLKSFSLSPEGYTMQILTVTGNHDTGSNSMDGTYTGLYDQIDWKQDNPNIPLFFFFFPHHESSGSNSSPPSVTFRKPYHAHTVGSASLFLAMDSGHVASYQDQVAWADKQLADFNLARQGQPCLKLVTYHVPFYAFPEGKPVERGAELGKPVWLPLFDRQGVQVAFENHVHAFKRTVPLRADKPNATGTTYVGDGYWGISPHDDLPGGQNEDAIVRNPNSRLASGGLKYHVWRGLVNPASASMRLEALGHEEVFDNFTVAFSPMNH